MMTSSEAAKSIRPNPYHPRGLIPRNMQQPHHDRKKTSTNDPNMTRRKTRVVCACMPRRVSNASLHFKLHDNCMLDINKPYRRQTHFGLMAHVYVARLMPWIVHKGTGTKV